MNTRRLCRAAWNEWKVTHQLGTSHGEVFVGLVHMPGWFRRSELGYGAGEGPSIGYTLAHLSDINRRNLLFLHANPASDDEQITVPARYRMTARSRTRQLRDMISSAA